MSQNDSEPSLKKRRVDSDDGRWDQQFSEESDAEQSVHSHSDVDHPSEADHHPSKADEQPAVQTPKSRKRTVSKLLSKEELSESRAAMEKTGVVYLSRIPPGMSPTKIRQLLSAYKSRVLRIFLSPESMAVYTRRLKSGGSKKRQFTEGWVEFEDKKVAKKVAEMLNAQQIGGKKGSRWYDDLWNIKYLPKFKWHHLTEQIAYQNASRAEKLRNEISQEKRENQAFVQNMERSKMIQNIQRKKQEKQDTEQQKPEEIKVRRQFSQRSVVDKHTQPRAPVQSGSKILNRVFE